MTEGVVLVQGSGDDLRCLSGDWKTGFLKATHIENSNQEKAYQNGLVSRR